ncbi:MAG: nucleotidyltransferase family protein [Chloroflexota bacterium]
MDCVITAGGVPKPDDPLFAYTQGKPKALLEINGRSLLNHIVTAFHQASTVENIVVVGLDAAAAPELANYATFLPDQGSLLANGLFGISWLRQNKQLTGPVLMSSSDIPTITPTIIDHFVNICHPFDRSVYYNFITRETLEKRFPGSKRTYVKLKGLEIAGGDLMMAQSELAESHYDFWQAGINGRKHAWKLARTVGWRTLLKLLTRRLSLSDIEDVTERIFGTPSKIILNPNAEIGMDIDKPNQLELLRKTT